MECISCSRYNPIAEHDRKNYINKLKAELETAKRSLRDEFAMGALSGMIAHHGNLYPESGAIDAYKWADAMMEARSLNGKS